MRKAGDGLARVVEVGVEGGGPYEVHRLAPLLEQSPVGVEGVAHAAVSEVVGSAASSHHVCMVPFPFTSIIPRDVRVKGAPAAQSHSATASDAWMQPATPWCSGRAATFTTSLQRS